MLPYSYLVLGVTPATNEAQVALNTKITITFAKHIDKGTLNGNNIRLRKVNGEFVEYDGVYDSIKKAYTLTPKEELAPNTQYQTLIMGGEEGVVSIDGSYLPTTKTYEFVTEQKEGEIVLANLALRQDIYFLQAEWELPSGLVDGEEVYFNVKVSTSKEPLANALWPLNPLEGKTTACNIIIPYRFELGRGYFVHVQGVSGDKETEWLTEQIFMETMPELVTEKEEEQDSVDPGMTLPITEQITVIDFAPQQGEFTIPDEIVVVFSHPINPDSFPPKSEVEDEEEEPDEEEDEEVEDEEVDEEVEVEGVSLEIELEPQPTRNPLFYVVKAPYKESLSLLDLRGTYSYKNAIDGFITVDEENPNVLVWVRDEEANAEEFEADTEYTVVISKDLTGAYTLPLGYTFTFGFSGTPEHMHGEMEHIQEVLGSFGMTFSVSFLQSLMKKYSQYACDIWMETSGYDESLHQDGDAPYFIHQYVNTQVLIDSLLRGGRALYGSGNESITLGDLSVAKNGGSFDAGSIATMLDELKGRLKKWEDLINDQHKRGYASPVVAVRGEDEESYPEYVSSRTTMTNLGE